MIKPLKLQITSVGSAYGGLMLIAEDAAFTFKKLCPYCQGNLTYVASGWQEDDHGYWEADSFDMECSNEPSEVDSNEWEEWLRLHSDLPYVRQLPVDKSVKKWINDRYRYQLK